MIKETLSSLGLNDEESIIYTHLLELGKSTAGVLAKQLNSPRPTIYGHLKRLHELGLVAQSLNMEGIKLFSAEPPEKINILFEQKIENLVSSKNTYKELLEGLRLNSAPSFSNPKFQLFEGEEGLRHILKDMLLYRSIETYSFWPIKAMLEILSPEFFRYLNKERIRSNLYTKAIWPASQVVSTAKYPYLGGGSDFKREIRIAPPEINFSMGYWVYANKVAFISSRKESIGFIVESQELAEMMLVQHHLVWKMSTPLEETSEQAHHFIQKLG